MKFLAQDERKVFCKGPALMAYNPNTDKSVAVILPIGVVHVAATTAGPGCGCRTADLPGCVSGTGLRCLCSQTWKVSDKDKPVLADSGDFHNHEFDDNIGRDYLPGLIFWSLSKERQGNDTEKSLLGVQVPCSFPQGWTHPAHSFCYLIS